MIATVARWGNSLALRIPRAFARDIALREGAAVDLAIQDGALVVRPVEQLSYDLDALLGQIRAENLHAEVATGGSDGLSVGNEF